jgi:aconitase A
MGVLPLQFKDGTDRKSLKLDGRERFDIHGDIRRLQYSATAAFSSMCCGTQ